MYSKINVIIIFFYISILYKLPINCQQLTQSVISFEPSYLSLTIGENRSVIIRLLLSDLIPPDLTLEFLYNNQSQPIIDYINRLPNITFTKQINDDQSHAVIINGRRQGHLVVTAQSTRVNISSIYNFLLIDIARNRILTILVQFVGWIYFFAWSISFYPQIILNFRRKSVVGLNFDFLTLNLFGHSCYSIFNICLYTSHQVQQEYYQKHPHGILPVLLNDVLFSVHAVFACLITVTQCVFFERGKQRVSYTARLIGILLIIFLLITTIISLTKHLSTLTLLYFYSYVKLIITIIKYVPQAWMNYKRQSTEGWSIGNILLDLTGGLLSVMQMFFLAINYDDWSSIFGSPTKLGLGLFSILFDLLFIIQHYILYRSNPTNLNQSINNEHTPIFQSVS